MAVIRVSLKETQIAGSLGLKQVSHERRFNNIKNTSPDTYWNKNGGGGKIDLETPPNEYPTWLYIFCSPTLCCHFQEIVAVDLFIFQIDEK